MIQALACKTWLLHYPGAPSYLYNRLLGYVTIGYIEPRTRDLGNWSPRANLPAAAGMDSTDVKSQRGRGESKMPGHRCAAGSRIFKILVSGRITSK